MARSKILDVFIDDIKFPNIGLAKSKEVEAKIEIKGALPGQYLRITGQRRSKRIKGRIIDILEKAPYEITPLCPKFGICGGCAFLNIDYQKELEIKAHVVQKLLSDFVSDEIWEDIVPAPSELHYRNKMEFSFGDDGTPNRRLTLGMRKRGSFYEAVDASDCLICHPDFGKILNATRNYFESENHNFYHRRNNTGSLRHLVIRRGFFTDEILINLITTPDMKIDCDEYVNLLLQLALEGKIAGILHTTNSSPADVVIPEKVFLLYGQNYIHEKISGLQFKISPFSFFQTNSAAAEILYRSITDFAGDISNDIVYDLYCGCGTITQILASKAKEVIGIELIEEAINAANENAIYNNILNCRFICADVRNAVKNLPAPDLIILDPPREGIHPKALIDIAQFGAPKIIYVSCKATSFANDMKTLSTYGYSVQKIRCHDLFPKTANIEVIALLSLGESC